MSEKIVVGLSGGVDSSVAAFLLQEQGYDVECIFMKNWEDDDNEICSSANDYNDALEVCEILGLPLHSVNFSNEYWDKVFAHFLEEYKAGRTPNPDVLCNREIKFKAFLDYALQLGISKIATGHYANVKETPSGFQLLKGIDRNKDQSYFLYMLSKKPLSKSTFPIGKIKKQEVRKLAKKAGLPIAEKKDSTGICFIGERNFRQFIERYLPEQPGDIVSNEGEKVGTHNGLMYYTIGQRKGLGIGGGHGKSNLPWYVIEKIMDKNILIVCQGNDHPLLYSNIITASQLHWISGAAPDEGKQLAAKIRYRQKDKICRIEPVNGDSAIIYFEEPVFAAAPGQSVVLYDGEICLGGGIIEPYVN
jgi:tRNA-specific 2-thiouridylase